MTNRELEYAIDAVVDADKHCSYSSTYVEVEENTDVYTDDDCDDVTCCGNDDGQMMLVMMMMMMTTATMTMRY